MQTLITPPPHDAPSLPYEEQVDHAREALPADLPDDPSKVLVALDVDGTLVTANGASENVRRTVASSIEAGINVVIATGRGVAATRPVFQELELPSGFSVSSNGAQIVRWERAQDGRHVYEKLSETYFDPRAAVQAVLGRENLDAAGRDLEGAVAAAEDDFLLRLQADVGGGDGDVLARHAEVGGFPTSASTVFTAGTDDVHGSSG